MDVERGLFMGTMRSDFFNRLARRTALNLQRILLGEDAGTIPVAFSAGTRLTINMTTARAINLFPRFEIISEAELISEKREDIKRHLTLAKAMREAMKVNLDLAVQDHIVAAGEQDIRSAWSNLKPRLEVSGTGVQIDDDRAEASMGQQAERSLTGSATITQVVYSEPTWGNVTAQRRLQESREAEWESVRLDIKFKRTAIRRYLDGKIMGS